MLASTLPPMLRATRLLQLIDVLRRHRFPVSGTVLARETGVSLRTLYRDIATLQAQGARIEGEAGVGYVLRPGFMLPPLMFSEDEIEALVLGSRWVASRADPRLGEAARQALARIAAVLPEDLRHGLESNALLVGPASTPGSADEPHLALLRQAIRTERKLVLSYRDLQDLRTTRTVWPFALGFFDGARVLAAWCELRQGFRHFRADRIDALTVSDIRYPARRQGLLKQWRAEKGIADPGS